MRPVLISVVLTFLPAGSAFSHSAAPTADHPRPSILWISCEDISPHLRCFGDTAATTPHLDRLARSGVRYTRAFTCYGVCAPSRTAIITGMWPPTLGAGHMRSKARLPAHVRCFPEYLREAGYYCCNNSKTDYNFHWNAADVWDDTSRSAHWKNRTSDDQPFFAVFNLTVTHESRVWPKNWKKATSDLTPDEFHDPRNVTVPDLYPDVPPVRSAIARLLDLILVMDRRVGRLLAELDEAGLTDRTIVVFWSDHGDGFARAKRWVHDSGTRVPLIVRIPERYRTGGQGRPGTVDDQLISLIDLAPTVLNLAGVPIPDHMQGQPFLGPNLPPPRQYVYSARDRIDERFDFVRSVRDGRYRYVRNFVPWLPMLQHVQYSERSVTRQVLRQHLAKGLLPEHLAAFFTVPRPRDELYDLQADPWELHNLAGDPSCAADLKRLRTACDRWQRRMRDAHLLPEALLIEEEARCGSRFDIFHGPGGEQRWQRVFDAATGLLPAAAGVRSDDPAVRWWSLTRLTPSVPDAAVLLQQGLQDASAAVRVAAARSLSGFPGHRPVVRDALATLLQDNREAIRHAAILAVDEQPWLAETLKDAVAAMMPRRGGNVDRVRTHVLRGDAFPVASDSGSPSAP